jgi:transposase InsO family protein
MYRILAANDQVRERRAQRQHPTYTKPQLVATAPNQVWTWDITKLPGPTKGTYFSLSSVASTFARSSSESVRGGLGRGVGAALGFCAR